MNSKQKFLLLCFCLFLISWSTTGCRNQGATAVASETATSSGVSRVQAPAFNLTDINGKALSLADLKGKVVFVDFWATWCPPCVLSSPEVENIKHEYANKNVEVVSISLDDSAEVVRSFVQRRNLTSRVLMASDSGVDVQYQLDGIPTFVIVDQKGYITARWAGFSPAMKQAWRHELDSLLKS
jgi:thiol-disulfide isomerase/thioredoxin